MIENINKRKNILSFNKECFLPAVVNLSRSLYSKSKKPVKKTHTLSVVKKTLLLLFLSLLLQKNITTNIRNKM